MGRAQRAGGAALGAAPRSNLRDDYARRELTAADQFADVLGTGRGSGRPDVPNVSNASFIEVQRAELAAEHAQADKIAAEVSGELQMLAPALIEMLEDAEAHGGEPPSLPDDRILCVVTATVGSLRHRRPVKALASMRRGRTDVALLPGAVVYEDDLVAANISKHQKVRRNREDYFWRWANDTEAINIAQITQELTTALIEQARGRRQAASTGLANVAAARISLR